MVPEFHAVFSGARLINRLAVTCSRVDALEAELHRVRGELQLERAHRLTLFNICCRLNSKVAKVGQNVGKWVGQSRRESLTITKRLGDLEAEIDCLAQF